MSDLTVIKLQLQNIESRQVTIVENLMSRGSTSGKTFSSMLPKPFHDIESFLAFDKSLVGDKRDQLVRFMQMNWNAKLLSNSINHFFKCYLYRNFCLWKLGVNLQVTLSNVAWRRYSTMNWPNATPWKVWERTAWVSLKLRLIW